MYSRWFNFAVVILWLSTMSWLVTKKLLPPLLVGEPPSYQTILRAQRRLPRVGWRMDLGGRRLGWALSTTRRLTNGLTEIRSRVHFDEFPLRDAVPGLLATVLGLAPGQVHSPELDADSTLIIDALGRLSRFESSLRIDPLRDPIKLQGAVEGAQLKLAVRVGDSFHTVTEHFPQDALLGGAFSPHTQLPGLRAGQTWTVPACSPLTPNRPLEILQAKVEGTEPVIWGGRPEQTWLVVYRTDPGRSLGGEETPRGRLWVRRDGTVLKQEVRILECMLSFVRLPDREATALANQVLALPDDRRHSSE